VRHPAEIVRRHNQLVAIWKGDCDCPGLCPGVDPETDLWLMTAINALAWAAGEDDCDFAQALNRIDLTAPGPNGLLVRQPELREVVILDAAGRPARVLPDGHHEEMECEVCGCTEFSACRTPEGPCHWVSPNLCSGCAEKETKGAA
jgi:hypothetical protein